MRKSRIRNRLMVFSMAGIISLSPLMSKIWSSIEPPSSKALYYDETYQVRLDEQSSDNESEIKSGKNTTSYSTSSQTISYSEPVKSQHFVKTDKHVKAVFSKSICEAESVPEDTSNSLITYTRQDTMKSSSLSDSVSETKYIDTLEESEYWALARIASREAGSASPAVQRAVISTILNRVKCHAFPDTIYDVVMQDGQFFDVWPKFTDANVVYRTLEREDVPDSIKESIHTVITEGDFSNGAYFYISPQYLPQSTIDRFHQLYGEPCLIVEGGEFFTKDYGEG